MPRLLVHVEGQTEEAFVNELLRPHLVHRGYVDVGARLMGNARQRDRRGGIKPWSVARKDIVRHLKEDTGCTVTTMVDYYGLPQSGDRAWPGRELAVTRPMAKRASTVETALLDDIAHEMGDGFDRRRFIPFVVQHEFEGLLFSDCAAFARGIGRSNLEERFQAIRNQFATPEEIDDSPATAPSRLVLDLMPEYQKPSLGTLAAREIGLDRIAQACPHFRGWLERLAAARPVP